jgi:hypothetical protein
VFPFISILRRQNSLVRTTDIHILHLDSQRWYYELLLHDGIYVVSDNVPDRNMGICVDDMHNCLRDFYYGLVKENLLLKYPATERSSDLVFCFHYVSIHTYLPGNYDVTKICNTS